jgi:hypothetical protein
MALVINGDETGKWLNWASIGALMGCGVTLVLIRIDPHVILYELFGWAILVHLLCEYLSRILDRA